MKCAWLNESSINFSKAPVGINMKSDSNVIDGRIWCEFKLYASKIVWLTNKVCNFKDCYVLIKIKN